MIQSRPVTVRAERRRSFARVGSARHYSPGAMTPRSAGARPRPSSGLSRPAARRRSRRRRDPARARLVALGVVGMLALFAGILVGKDGGPPKRETVQKFARAWAAGDLSGMHALLSPAAAHRASFARFTRTYRDAAALLTLRTVTTGKVGAERDGAYPVPVTFATTIFGTLRGTVLVPVTVTEDAAGVDWRANLVYPGLRVGETLSRTTRLPPRATIEARDGTPLAKGEARLSDLGSLASDIAGRIGPPPPDRAAALERAGVPAAGPVGLTGLEREFDAELRGAPGGTLRAGGRVLADVPPRRGTAVRTTIDPDVQRAAVDALAGRYGGVAVIRPGDGEVLALAGIASSAPQPPGSVFKIVTLAAALASGKATKRSTYPYETQATLDGRAVANANGERCGGTLRQAFADSCNSVFAPLGAAVGAGRLVKTAEAFGFNAAPPFAFAARSTIPAASVIGDDLAVGSTAIGQGQVLATPLLLAGVAATIGMDGERAAPTLERGKGRRRARVLPARVARTVGSYMRSVVTGGTGLGAALPGVAVAGKTGTAELRSTVNADPTPEPGTTETPPVDDPTDTDAWFAGFAPAGAPKVAVAVLLVGAGAGGATAAPVAAAVLRAALSAGG
jgi:hypothetical protein